MLHVLAMFHHKLVVWCSKLTHLCPWRRNFIQFCKLYFPTTYNIFVKQVKLWSYMWSKGTSRWFSEREIALPCCFWHKPLHLYFFFLSFFLCLLVCLSVSLWFRTELAIHHPVHRWHIPPNHPGDGVCLLETIQVRALLFLLVPLFPLLSLSPSLSSSLSLVGFDIALEDVTRISSSSAVSPYSEHLVKKQ